MSKQPVKPSKKSENVPHVREWYDNSGKPLTRLIFTAPYVLSIPIQRRIGDVTMEVGEVVLIPGINHVPTDHWEMIRDNELVAKRIDEGHLREDIGMTRADQYKMTETNKARLIEELSSKATPIKYHMPEIDNDSARSIAALNE